MNAPQDIATLKPNSITLFEAASPGKCGARRAEFPRPYSRVRIS